MEEFRTTIEYSQSRKTKKPEGFMTAKNLYQARFPTSLFSQVKTKSSLKSRNFSKTTNVV